MAARGRVLPEGLNGRCPYTLLGLCVSKDGQPTSVQEAAANEVSVESREQLSLKAIGTAYRKAALKSHPDKNKGREQEAASNFVQVNLAFAFLSDKAQRDSYHSHLRALLGLRLQREHHRQRWTQQDRERQRFKEELNRKEAEARNAPQWQSEEETLRQIREQNEQLLRKKQQEIDTARRQRFRDNLAQQQKQKQPASHIWGKAEAAEDEDILHRSLLLSWPSAAKSETGVSEGKQAGAASGNIAAHPTELPPSPASLASQLWMHGAVDLCFFSKARGLACVSFTSKERAIAFALLLRHRRKTNSSSSKTQGLSAKLANKAKDHLALLQRVLRAADAYEQEKPEAESAATEAAANTKIEQDEIDELARETEEAATAFAAALAAVQGNNTRQESPAATETAATETAATAAAATAAAAAAAAATPGEYSGAVSGVHAGTDIFGLATASVGGKSAAEARAAAAAFGLGSDQMTQPTSCAAARMLDYIRACNKRGSADVRERQAEIDREKGWEWLGGSKVAANMSLEQLEAAAFGALERKKQQLKIQE